jgi:hypothetical protein
MIARHHCISVLLSAALTVTLRAAPIPPPAAAERKGTIPSTPIPAATASSESSAVSSPPANSVPAAKSPAATVPATAAAPAPTNTPASAPAATPPPPEKSGILSAVKSKGPPSVPKGSVAPPPLPPRFRQVRGHMGALFDTRNAAPPAPTDPRANPFRPAGAVPNAPLVVADGTTVDPVAINIDLTTLQQAVATLKVRGVVQRGTLLQLVITSAPGKEGTYKEGDIINVLLPPGDPVHLRVRQVSRYSVTLALNDAEMTLKF